MKLRMAGTALPVSTSAGTISRRLAALGVAVLGVTALAACGSDKSPSAAAAATTTAAVGQEAPVPPGTPVNVTLREASDTAYVLTADKSTVKAGNLTFKVTDTGKKDHEMVILRLDGNAAFDKLAIDSATNRVSEDTNVGETGDPNLKPGEVRSFNVNLPAGNYVLVCNIEKHYGLGMRSLLTVTP
jgi:uncharacterized cupredoxin-like copper-binding protein